MLERAKKVLRLTTSAYDEEIAGLIAAAYADLGIAGIKNLLEGDPIVDRAVLTYCKVNFGTPEDYDKLKASYDEQKAQLQTATGYGLEETWPDTM